MHYLFKPDNKYNDKLFTKLMAVVFIIQNEAFDSVEYILTLI